MYVSVKISAQSNISSLWEGQWKIGGMRQKTGKKNSARGKPILVGDPVSGWDAQLWASTRKYLQFCNNPTKGYPSPDIYSNAL